MKKLFLVRHAKASRDLAFIIDIERPLTERGFHDAKLISGNLQKKKHFPELLVSSPAIRAYSTAMVFASTFHLREDAIQLERDLYDSSVKDYLEIIRGLKNSCDSAMIFGHNNVLSETVAHLLHDDAFESLPTCGVALLDCNVNTWKTITSGSCTLVSEFYPSQVK